MTLSERGARARKKRLRLRLSLFTLAKKAGCHPNSVMLAEKGATSEALLGRIEAALADDSEEGRP